MVTRVLLTIALLGALSGCSGMPGQSPPAATPSPTSPTALPATPDTTPTVPLRLMLWLPASLAPERTTSAGSMLVDRLAQFEESHPGITIQIRVKADSGTAGLLETLIAAAAAAPAALPDAALLDPVGLTTAALKGLIVPLEGIVAVASEPEWYAHAVEAARVDGVAYGLPVGAEAQVWAYRTDAYESAPLSWSNVLSGPVPVLLPAADPTASFTLAQLLAARVRLYDNSGRPMIDQPALVDILSFYHAARSAGVLPLSARQYASAADSWRVFKEGRALAAEARLRPFLLEANPAIHAAMPLPTRDGAGISLVWNWSWAVVTRDPARQQVVAELINWLSKPEFLAAWTRAAGLLPSTPASLQRWPAGSESSLASRLATAAVCVPSAETIGIFGPPLQQAVQAVLSGQSSPEEAARAAAQAVQNP